MKKMYLSTIPENWKHKKKAEIMYKETQQQQQKKKELHLQVVSTQTRLNFFFYY